MVQVAQIWRHPIKSHGREQIENVHLTAGKTMPWDRVFAVTHHHTKFDPAHPAWTSCRNFMIGSMTPQLAGIWARVHPDDRKITLHHNDLGDLTFRPDVAADAARFITWVTPLCPPDRLTPNALVSADNRGLTDSEFPSISIVNLASHQAVEHQIGMPLEPERWRANIWLDGLPAWAEEDWVGQTIRIGTATLAIREIAVRCRHTMANPVTGQRDVDTLKTLREGWGHQNFGLYAEVLTDGDIRCGDTCEVL